MKLVYNDSSHSYWLGGKRVKSASKVAQIAADSFTIEQWRGRQHVIGMTLDPTLRERAAVDLDNREAIQQIADDALNAAKANARAQRGTQRHRVFELGLLGEQSKFITDQQIADWKVLERTLDRYGLTPMMDRVEQFVAWPEHGVVGRYDAYLGYRGAPALFDLKGGENAVKYPHSTAVQLWLYRNAPHTSKTIIRNGDKSEVTEWTTHPEDADEDFAYVIYCDDHHDVGELWQIDLSMAETGGRSALGIVDWRKSYNYGRDITTQVAAPVAPNGEQPSTGEPVPSPVDTDPDRVQDSMTMNEILLDAAGDPEARRFELRHRYDLLNDEQKADYTTRKQAIDTNDLDAVERLLDEVEPFNRVAASRATCDSCKAPIYWAVTEKGHAMPIDVASVDDGNIHVDDNGIARVVGHTTLDDPRPLHLSHFVTCPNADQHRTKRKKAPPDEGPDIDLRTMEVMRCKFDTLSDGAKFWIASLTAEGRKADVDWRPNAKYTVRRFELARAVIRLAHAYDDPEQLTDIVRGLLGAATGREEVEQDSLPLGASIGTLDAAEAARFAALVDDYLSTGSAA